MSIKSLEKNNQGCMAPVLNVLVLFHWQVKAIKQQCDWLGGARDDKDERANIDKGIRETQQVSAAKQTRHMSPSQLAFRMPQSQARLLRTRDRVAFHTSIK